MKHIHMILAGLLLALALPVWAQNSQRGFSVTSTNLNAVFSWAVVPAGGETAGRSARIQLINAVATNAAAEIQFYRVLAQATATYTNSTVTLFVNTTNTTSGGNWQSDYVVIRHTLDGKFEYRATTSNTGATNVVLTVAPLGTVIPGDQIYLVSPGVAAQPSAANPNKLPWGNSSGSVMSAAGLYIGQKNQPVLVEMYSGSGGAVASLNLVTGDYVP